jgi:transketolase
MNSIEFSKQIRELSVDMVYRAHASHIGGALSMADIVAVLYNDVLRYDAANPQWDGRDRFLLSKGHACVSLYAALALKGFFPKQQLDTYGTNGSTLLCHISHHVPGVEISAGSLGHGLPYAIGFALAAKRLGKAYNTYVLLGDGEMDEGSNWEGLMFAAHHRLNNLCVIIDYNKIQSFGNTNDVMRLEPLADKIKAFNCRAIEIDGHDHAQIKKAFEAFSLETERPTVVIANTIKGKGVSFMENNIAWHYKSPNDEQYKTALEEIEQ